MDEDDLEVLGLGIGDDELIGEELEDLLDFVEGVELVGDDDDYLGDEDDDSDDVLGDDDDFDEVGARRRRRIRGRTPRGRRRKRNAVATQRRAALATVAKVAKAANKAAALRSGKRVVTTQSQRGRVLLLGGDAVQTSPTGGQLLVTTTAQELARVDRLFITATDATGAVLAPSSYRIADIKVGTKSQFAALPALPGTMFQADATGHGASLALDTVQPGTDFSVVIADAPPGSRFTWGAFATALR